jgi:hypothetical protein
LGLGDGADQIFHSVLYSFVRDNVSDPALHAVRAKRALRVEVVTDSVDQICRILRGAPRGGTDFRLLKAKPPSAILNKINELGSGVNSIAT